MLLGARKIIYHERRLQVFVGCLVWFSLALPSLPLVAYPQGGLTVPFTLLSFPSIFSPLPSPLSSHHVHAHFPVVHQPQTTGKVLGDESSLFTRNVHIILVPQKGDKCNATSRTYTGSLPEGFSSRLK